MKKLPTASTELLPLISLMEDKELFISRPKTIVKYSKTMLFIRDSWEMNKTKLHNLNYVFLFGK